jgi:hypothetical protein
MTQVTLEPGDHIFVVAGNSHPVILRPSKKYADTWHAVAECYPRGFMDDQPVWNMPTCARLEKVLYAMPLVQNLKGTERNPRCDEIKDEPDGLWKWHSIE